MARTTAAEEQNNIIPNTPPSQCDKNTKIKMRTDPEDPSEDDSSTDEEDDNGWENGGKRRRDKNSTNEDRNHESGMKEKERTESSYSYDKGRAMKGMLKSFPDMSKYGCVLRKTCTRRLKNLRRLPNSAK